MSTSETVIVADAEDPSVLNSNVTVGVRLWASATVFLFMSFVFAFFYLRALNTNHLFRAPHGDPPVGWGVAVLACVLVSVVVFDLSRRQLNEGLASTWRMGATVAVFVGLAAVVLQVVEYFNLRFGAMNGGLDSVFFGFTVVFGVFWLGAVYWMETLWAQSLRQPATASGEIHAPSRLLRPSADSCVVYLYVMAVIEALAFILLCLVK